MAMQVVASSPEYVSIEDVPQEVVGQEKAIYRQQFLDEGKPEHILDRIVEGKLAKYYERVCLLEQPFIKDQDVKIEELVREMIATLGENIVLKRFARFAVGE
jgi:elongation factor Ts